MTFKEVFVDVLLPLLAIVFAGGGVAAFVGARATNRKTKAEAARIAAETAGLVHKSDLDGYAALVDQLQEDNERLRQHLTASDERIAETRKLIDAAEARYREQVEALTARYEAQAAALEARHRREVAAHEAQHREQMVAMESRHRQEIEGLRTGILVLINQLRTLGVEPAWQPEWAADCVGEDERKAP